MSKINNQSNRLDNINFLQDITPETAANYSGGSPRNSRRPIGDGRISGWESNRKIGSALEA